MMLAYIKIEGESVCWDTQVECGVVSCTREWTVQVTDHLRLCARHAAIYMEENRQRRSMEDHGREVPGFPGSATRALEAAGELPKPPADIHQFESGAKSTVEKPRYDLIPQIAEELLAERFGYGADKHGERNYLKGKEDPKFLRDRKNHLFEHVRQYIRFNRRSDLAAILCNAAILADCGEFKDDRTNG